jgi:cyclophilin family peptidyl-prolyl cis-trans isomerase
VLEQLQQAYGDDMRVVYRHFPLSSIHDKATLASEAAEAAGAQDAFWEYNNLLYQNQGDWSGLSKDQASQKFIDYAAELGLDTDRFAADLDGGTYSQLVQEAETAAQMAGLPGTPTLFVNGYPFPTQQIPLSKEGVDFFLNVVRLVENQYDAPEQVIEPDKSYQATISTEKGDVVIDLFPDTAPVNVNSFVFLVQQGWYDDVTFHRVLPGFMAQGGDPSGLGMGWPGYRCDDEVTSERTFDEAGLVALANSGPNTNGAQFFITYGPTPHLNEGFTLIGKVVSGQEVIEALTPRDPDQNPNFTGDKIVDITVQEK